MPVKTDKRYPKENGSEALIDVKTEIAIAKYETAAPFFQKKDRKPRR